MTPPQPHAPGSLLRRFARLLFNADTLARVVDPTFADLEHEVREAGDNAIARRAAMRRGYLAFWKLVVLSPFVFTDWPGRRQFAQSLTHVVAIVVLLFVTFGAQSDLMMWLLLKLHELDPQSQVYKGIISGASLGPYAWMLAPIAIVILAALGRSSPFRIAPAAVMMVCVATVTAATSYGAAGFLAGFSGIGARGTASIKDVLPAVDALAIPSLLALGMATLTAMIVIISLWRARDAVALGSGSATGLFNPASIVLAVSMAVSLVAMNQWLLLNQELFDVALALTRPPVRGPRGGSAAQDLIGRTEIAIQMALLGAVIVLTTLATAFAAWRGSRTPHANALLAWTTRLAVVVMLAGCLWHADAIAGQWQIFRAETAHLRSR